MLLLQVRAADTRTELLGNVGFAPGAFRVAEAGRALARVVHVVDDRVLALRGDPRRRLVEPERLAHAPSCVVVGTGGVSAHSQAADDIIAIVKRKPAAEHDHAADAL